jgi:hypothetical protein
MPLTFLSAKKIYGWKDDKDFWLFYGKVIRISINPNIFEKSLWPWRCF